MGTEFKIMVERDFDSTPERLWQAVTVDAAAWLFPTDGMVGAEVVSERPTHHINRMEGPDGWFNQLEQVISPLPDGRSHMRWVHSGVFDDAGDAQEDGVRQHTEFYLHTLNEYLVHFDGRPVLFVDVQAPAASTAPDAFETLRSALGLDAGSVAGQTTLVQLPGVSAAGAVVDYAGEHFIGLRSADTLLRFFGRNAFGGPVGMTVHHFGSQTADALTLEWTDWLTALY